MREKIPDNHENKEICSLCNGKCCKHHPCAVFPEDFESITEESILDKINSGYCFDYWEGSVLPEELRTGWFIRPRMKRHLNKYIHAGWSGECIFFEDGIGCKLSEKERPTQGRALIPSENKICDLITGYDKRDCVIAWLPYNDIIEKVIKKLKDDDDNTDTLTEELENLEEMLKNILG